MKGKMTNLPVFGGSARIQLRTLALIRWVAILGQLVALLVVHFGLDFGLPILAALAVVAVSALFNAVTAAGRPFERLGELEVSGYLAFDIVQLTVLLYLTGGLQNPFAFLLLAPVAVSATVLSLNSTVALSGLALACISVLSLWHFPLPWKGPAPSLPPTYILGIFTALAIGILFFAAYTWRVAEEARRLSEALTATQLALAREQQLSAVGALAAAVAHQLGSPLGTIAVAAREISLDLPAKSPLAEDVELLISETARCRDILAELAHNPAGDAAPFSSVPIGSVIESAAAVYHNETVTMVFESSPLPDWPHSPEPRIASAPEIIHGIGNLVQNAVQFSRQCVDIRTRWTDVLVEVVIEDDGPGFSPLVLERIGEPYMSVRSVVGGELENHMGLGIFIAQTLLSHTGATVDFFNSGTGATVIIRWDRATLEPDFNPTT
ncbi:MAG: ActS/PrrB/RegB family redox-sensitive histidine kinase [Proteobacteria bacterium]|nr:ActS/PrrB/RegB family redox-sensitive histidine kinase [Pseudomonadota bacterium]